MTQPPHDPLTYKQAGVDRQAGSAMVDLIRHFCQRTYNPRVLSQCGSGAGLLRLDFNERLFARNYKEPVLIAAANSVGTKVKLAAQLRRFDTVGLDLVALNVNDLVVQAGEPLLLLDHLAIHKLDPAVTAQIVKGVSDGCVEAGCALLGGETAEMPAVYAPGEFDLAGFAVGVAERKRIWTGDEVEVGDSVIGLASNGLHANGFALVREILRKKGAPLDAFVPEIGCSLAEELLRPTRLYARPIQCLLSRYKVKRIVKAMAHITGSGLPGRLPRVLPPGLDVRLKRDAWTPPSIFPWLQKNGPVDLDEMFHVFNMGIGFVLIVRPTFTKAIMTHLRTLGERPFFLGKVKKGAGEPKLEWA